MKLLDKPTIKKQPNFFIVFEDKRKDCKQSNNLQIYEKSNLRLNCSTLFIISCDNETDIQPTSHKLQFKFY
jgi:hypothetical protein